MSTCGIPRNQTGRGRTEERDAGIREEPDIDNQLPFPLGQITALVVDHREKVDLVGGERPKVDILEREIGTEGEDTSGCSEALLKIGGTGMACVLYRTMTVNKSPREYKAPGDEPYWRRKYDRRNASRDSSGRSRLASSATPLE